MQDILGFRGKERSLWPAEKAVRDGLTCGRFWEGRDKAGGELFKSTLAFGCGRVSRTGLYTRLLAMPGSLGEFILVQTLLGSPLQAG